MTYPVTIEMLKLYQMCIYLNKKKKRDAKFSINPDVLSNLQILRTARKISLRLWVLNEKKKEVFTLSQETDILYYYPVAKVESRIRWDFDEPRGTAGRL